MTRMIKSVAFGALYVVTFCIALVVVLPYLTGMQRYVITGGSMTGTIDKGSVVFSKVVPVGQLSVGDIVTFVPPSYSGAVTHRIAEITTGPEGQRVFQTKGDANDAADPWQVTFTEGSVARHVFHVSYVGYALALLSERRARMLLIGLPALLIALSLLWSIWRSAGAEVRRREDMLSLVQELPTSEESR